MTTPGKRRLSVVGLGYVGLPVAVAFGRAGWPVIAYDADPERIAELSQGIDRTHEVSGAALATTPLTLTDDSAALDQADFHIVAVPTPITDANRPDLGPLLTAAAAVGRHLRRGGIVVFESTVYPGCTEDDCVPVLERESGLRLGRDFAIGYSPERINPGDHEHRFETITKVVSASDPETLSIVAEVYGSVVTAGIHRAPDIRTAEAAKVIENVQRDLNIALMNELAVVFDRLGLDTGDVLAAARTKWNFLPFTPGLVGGHCIGVDPYYLTHRAERAGYIPQVILAGRRINDGMGAWVAQQTVKHLLASGVGGRPTVTVLGLTFKTDVPDVRNSGVADVIRELREFGADVQACDPLADPARVARAMGVTPVARHRLKPADAVILAVAHHDFHVGGWPLIQSLLRGGRGIAIDLPLALDRAHTPAGITLWRP